MPLTASRYKEIVDTLRMSDARGAIDLSENPAEALNAVNPNLNATEVEIVQFCADYWEPLPPTTA